MLFVLAVLASSRTYATPLYGGYNGESETWVEYSVTGINTVLFSAKVFLGVDVNNHRWAKFRITAPPYILRLDVTYDSADILSVNVTTLLPWPVQIGSEIDIYGEGRSLWWFVAYLVTGVSGVDSEGTRWVETGLPGVYGSGSDSKGNQWAWIKILDWLFGAGEDFAVEGYILNENTVGEVSQALLPLSHHLAGAYAPGARTLLERFTEGKAVEAMALLSEKFRKGRVPSLLARNPVLSPPGELQPGLDALAAAIAEDVFTGEVREELQELLSRFARDVNPHVKKIGERITTPSVTAK